MSIDTKQLSERNKIKTLLVTKGILDKKLQQIQEENRNLELCMKDEQLNLNKVCNEVESLKEEIIQLDAVECKAIDKKYVKCVCVPECFQYVNFKKIVAKIK